MKRAVITGIGIYSCIGVGKEAVTKSLRNGKSGIGIDPKRTEYGYMTPLSGILTRPNMKEWLDRKQRIYLSEEAEYAYMSTREALDDAQITDEIRGKESVGILFGNDSSTLAVVEAHEAAVQSKSTLHMGQSAVFKTMNSNISMNLATLFGLRGINLSVSAACASSSHAIGLGLTLIRQGLQDVLICGGAQEVNHICMASFDAIGAFSKRIDSPAEASRPFDRDRDGLVPSGGSASIVLEEYEHAKRRGAKIYGEVVGYGFSSNGGSIAVPDTDGYELAIRNALKDAQIGKSEIDYVNAHATSTPLGDAAEAEAIYRTLGGDIPVSSTKSMTGHECWMAGASEIVYSVLMMEEGFIASNKNFENPDEITKKINIISQMAEREIRCFLSNSFGFGGTNSCLIVRKID